jgi:hypothetical protein
LPQHAQKRLIRGGHLIGRSPYHGGLKDVLRTLAGKWDIITPRSGAADTSSAEAATPELREDGGERECPRLSMGLMLPGAFFEALRQLDEYGLIAHQHKLDPVHVPVSPWVTSLPGFTVTCCASRV